MKRLLIVGLFVLGLCFALFNYRGLADQGTFNEIIVDFREDFGAAQIEQQVQTIAQTYHSAPHYNSEFSMADHVFVLKGDRKVLAALRDSPVAKYTEFIEPAYIYRTLATPNDPDYSKQWNLRAINAESAWETTRGNGVTVAVIDTGVSPVLDLKQTRFVKGYDFVNDREDAKDDNGHGTHVAGTIAQSTNNNFGVAGVAYEASIMPLKVLSAEGGGTVADIAEAIKFAADKGAGVINMSLGGGGESKLMNEAIAYAHRKGVVIIAAAGNSAASSAEYPARYPHVIGVSALDAAGNITGYSNYGAGVDLAAPGGAIRDDRDRSGGILQHTINPDTGEPMFEFFQGTSMAAPHVAGVAALIRATGVTNPDEVETVLKKSALTVKDDVANHFGAGKLDAAAAVKLAAQGKITFQDFWRWLRDNGYLNPRFWIDGGMIALWPKLIMVLGSYLFAWLLRVYLPVQFGWPLVWGLTMGSSGLFFLQGLYLFDAPQWPFRVLGSSIPELAGSLQGTMILNPITASVLIPLAFILLLLGHRSLKWFAIGSAIGVAVCLSVSAVMAPSLVWLGDGMVAKSFLISNAVLCLGLAMLAAKPNPTEVR